MRFMIAYMLRGEPGWIARHLGDELADVFNLEKVSERVAPRLTLKSLFETNSERQIEELKAVLSKFCQNRAPAPLRYDGFGQFDKRVVFINVRPSPQAVALIADLHKTLRVLPWIKFNRTDSEKRLHATLCYVEKRTQFEEIKKYLAGEAVQLDGAIDHISILVQEKEQRRGHHQGTWSLFAEFPLSAGAAPEAVTPEVLPEL